MTSLNRRSLLAGSAAAGVAALAAAGVAALAGPARAQETPGVTATELKIGCTTSLSGPVSALGAIARCSDAYFKMINEQGGIAGRKINFIFYDDAFNPRGRISDRVAVRGAKDIVADGALAFQSELNQ